mgnify:CR=1 FL=1
MLIIFEGVDYTGKTSISERLKEEMGAELFKMDFNKIKEYSKDASLQEFGAISNGINLAVPQLEKKLDKHLILDRSYMTEYVYSGLDINGGREQREGLYQAWLNLIDKEETYIVYLFSDLEDIIKRQKKDDDGDIKPHNIESVRAEYERILSESDLKYISINTSKNNVELSTDLIIKHLISDIVNKL